MVGFLTWRLHGLFLLARSVLSILKQIFHILRIIAIISEDFLYFITLLIFVLQKFEINFIRTYMDGPATRHAKCLHKFHLVNEVSSH